MSRLGLPWVMTARRRRLQPCGARVRSTCGSGSHRPTAQPPAAVDTTRATRCSSLLNSLCAASLCKRRGEHKRRVRTRSLSGSVWTCVVVNTSAVKGACGPAFDHGQQRYLTRVRLAVERCCGAVGALPSACEPYISAQPVLSEEISSVISQ